VFGVGGVSDFCRRFLKEDNSGVLFADGIEEVVQGVYVLYVPGEDGDVCGVSGGIW